MLVYGKVRDIMARMGVRSSEALARHRTAAGVQAGGRAAGEARGDRDPAADESIQAQA